MQASVAKARKYGQRRRISATRTATTTPPTAAAASFAGLRSGSSVYPRTPSPAPQATRPARRAVRDGARYSERGRRSRRPRRTGRRRSSRRRPHHDERALDIAVRVHAEHVASWPVGRAQPQGARARHARSLAEAPANPSRLRDGQDREPLAGLRHDAVPSEGEQADPDGARARAWAEVAREVAATSRSVCRPSGSGSPPAVPNQSIVPVVRVPSLRRARTPSTYSSTCAARRRGNGSSRGRSDRRRRAR